MKIATYYTTISNYGELGFGHACEPATFDDACDAYAERREEGADAVVFRCDPPKGGQAGMMTDVTADADYRALDLCRQRNQFPPEWMEDALAEAVADVAADRAHERAESMSGVFL